MSDRDALNAYMREWRSRPEVQRRERAKAAARSRALTRLADEHPERYRELLVDELTKGAA
ncbi:MAG: hypothetical protein JWO11_4485 [Nocardioides sp.]|nr:hypothetical protein [Nocardioides sp.]